MIYVADTATQDYIKSLNLNIETSIDSSSKHLILTDNFLKLNISGDLLYIDFSSKDIAKRIDPKAKKCSVVQAVEGRKKHNLNVLDTTAGLGKDTFTIAARGHTVIAIEKDSYIFLLFVDALARAKEITNIQEIANRINIINADSSEYIKNTTTSFDCAYVDPMFPERTKSAKVKKDMQIMHSVAFNNDSNNNQILASLLDTKVAKKVIVKRPVNAEFLADKKPSSQLKGKTNRFDIYLA